MPRAKKSKEELPYDADSVKQFIERLFSIEKEIKILREDTKELTEEFKEKINPRLVTKIIRMVKLAIDIHEKEKASDETVEEISNVVKDKINMILE